MRFTGSIPEAPLALSAMEPGTAPRPQDVSDRKERSGIFTASQIHKIITPTLKKPDNATFRQYIAEKAWERITGCTAENGRGAQATEWGHEHESHALFEFTMATGISVENTGVFQRFFKKEGFPFGATPDGIVSGTMSNRTHTVEVKCPFNGGIHFQNLKFAHDPEWFKAHRFEYYAQCQSAMWAADVDKCYWVSYDPGTSRERDSFNRITVEGFEKYRLFWTEFYLEPSFIKALEEAIMRAEDELLAMI